MSSAARKTRPPRLNGIHPVTRPLSGPSIPLLYEDDGFEEMGESDIHTRTNDILFYGLRSHFNDHPQYRVFSNLNLYYSKDDRDAYVSPDVMVVAPANPSERYVRSYRIGQDGPAPLFVAEVLSERTFQQRDLTDKPLVYAQMKVPEYALIDVTGDYLSVRVLLKKLLPGGAWRDLREPGDAFTSQLGFRVAMDSDEQIRVFNAKTGLAYLRPSEANERVRALEEELDRLRGKSRKRKKS
jgi:Uma2 family endonuclease